MGYLLIDDEKATNSSVSRNASSTTLSKKATTTNVSKAHSSLNDLSLFISRPAEMDVLCGQDKNFTQHPGNKLYRSIISSWSQRYGQSTNKQSKMRMTTEICKLMKRQYNSRFLKPTPMFKEHIGSNSEESNLVTFRWRVLTDQAARDKISHALRTSATASRKRQERRQKLKAARQQEQQNDHKQQPLHLHRQEDQPLAELEVDELWTAYPQSTRSSMQSFASIPESPYHVWYGDSQSTDSHKYESQSSFNSSSYMTSFPSQLCLDYSASWHADAHRNDLQDVEPLPLSSLVSFTISNEIGASLSQLLFDDSDL